jgi:hypothetical protein
MSGKISVSVKQAAGFVAGLSHRSQLRKWATQVARQAGGEPDDIEAQRY